MYVEDLNILQNNYFGFKKTFNWLQQSSNDVRVSFSVRWSGRVVYGDDVISYYNLIIITYNIIAILYYNLPCYNIMKRNKIVWKLPRGYCLHYWNTFSLLPDPAEHIKKNFVTEECSKFLALLLINHYSSNENFLIQFNSVTYNLILKHKK